ncbi:acyl carrier protein [Pseudomonas syringae]|uniref:acyl carrier protein n=1 Tax=Pseudomonas syringae TaxID=317 RepID=UPI002248BFB5|nr:acyl carrier protein [Pseudomonas syringae]UZS66442.1 acyl carrier protein [Pseudomonas syringae]
MNNLESRLRDELAALLCIEPTQLSITAKFDELGVDSLIGLRFSRKVHDLTNIEIDIESVFDYPTLAQLAAFLNTLLNDSDLSAPIAEGTR